MAGQMSLDKCHWTKRNVSFVTFNRAKHNAEFKALRSLGGKLTNGKLTILDLNLIPVVFYSILYRYGQSFQGLKYLESLLDVKLLS